MRLERGSWLTFLSRALVLGVVVFGAMRLAMARDGVAGGPSRSFLTVSGTLTGSSVPASPVATFRFSHNGGSSADAGVGNSVLCAPTVPITDRDTATGAFSVEVPLDQPGHECPASLFDGSDAFVEVAIGSTVVVPRRPINPVPYAVYAQQYGTPDCPVGYERDQASPSGRVYCRKRLTATLYDEVVRVGNGTASFWIDRYEASVNYAADASGTWLFLADTDLSYFPRNGQWGRARDGHAPYAFSVLVSPRSLPARWITWFQAVEACAASGKRLANGVDWVLAAQGTTDDPGGCQISATTPRVSGAGAGCESSWGVQDMIGNLAEWTLDWSLSPNREETGFIGTRWPDGYNRDVNVNVRSSARVSGTTTTSGLPAAVVRGGTYSDGEGAGVFSIDIAESPIAALDGVGFRCVITR